MLCDQLAPRGPLGGGRLSWSQATHASLVLRAQEWTGWRRPRRRPAPAWNLSLHPTQTCLTPRGLLASSAPRPDLCEYGDVCTKAHSEQELQEWTRRVRTAELREQAAWQEGLVPYKARLLDEYRRSSTEVLVVSGASCVGWAGRGPGSLTTAWLPCAAGRDCRWRVRQLQPAPGASGPGEEHRAQLDIRRPL